ncbi:hormone-sensitive lipase precursor [Salmo salar]|uniref:triacylglycerol lipase n=1 Tax=Salmo salar TaxID=8030 RepID=B5X4R8_SALSA|nr:hormone-sensitive lipase precursor [Salmo salar]ACI34299.1 Endothelial lipase precursor [Salmo salar]|eukprot:NP_001134007.1 hormone-sensitive lipase precursor [Salmo salar]
MKNITFSLWIVLLCEIALFASGVEDNELFKDEEFKVLYGDEALHDRITYNMRKSMNLDVDGCILLPGEKRSLQECGFNVTAKTFFIIHGWTTSGMFEGWMQKLVSAMMQREPEANVVIVDWIPMAHQLYPDAVNYTHQVGLSVATTINWLQEEQQLPLQNVHLIGYSLGAHVAGFAGTSVRGTIGRITGLDPAGPMFEGVEDDKRLSSGDADFVDILHTYTREALGMSIGIQQPIGDIDIYPNGGDVQPGCSLSEMLTGAAGGSFMDVIKCEHERAVLLFVDSLMTNEYMSLAYQCTDPERFKKGICLSCRKNRCNNIGYNAKKIRKRSNCKMYLKTRAATPFGGIHYQMKMHVFNRKHADDADPTFHVKLYGAHHDTDDLHVDLPNKVGLNLTNTFLVFTEDDIGDLLKIRLSWEGATESLGSFWKNMKKSFWSWNSNGTPINQVLEVRRIRVKCGETQKKFTFCAQDPSVTEISPGQVITYVKCRDGWEVKPSKKRLHNL